MALLKTMGCIGLCALTLGVGMGQVQAADEPANIVKYRKAVMRAIGGHMAALSAVAKGEISFSEKTAGHAHALHEMSKDLTALFPEGTDYETVGDTDVLPEIWTQWADFEAAAQSFEDESAKLAEFAESGDAAGFSAQIAQVGINGCSKCHDGYRYKK